MTEDDRNELRELIRAELAPMKSELAPMKTQIEIIRVHVDGLPLIGNAVDVLRRDMRLVRAAINDIGKTNITAGEVEAMHEDIDRVQSRQSEIETRLATVERSLAETSKP